MGLRDAFANQEEEDNTVDDSAKQPSTTPPPTLLAGTNGAPVTQPTASKAPKSSASGGRLQNLQKYIQANKGYKADTGGLAGQISSNIQQARSGLQQNLSNQQQAFNQQAQTAEKGLAYNPSAVANVASKASASDISDADKQAIIRQMNTQYQGPTELGGAQSLVTQGQKVTDLGNLAGTGSGRFQLLGQMFGRPNYSSGQKRLDQAILESDPTQISALNQARAGATAAGQEVNQALDAAGLRAQALSNLAAKTRAQTSEDINAQLAGIQSELEARALDFNKGQQGLVNTGAFSPGSNTARLQDPAVLKMAQDLGLPIEDIIRRFGTYDPATATAANIDPNKAGVFNALAGLVGKDLLQSTGQVQQGRYGINESGVQSALTPIKGWQDKIADVDARIAANRSQAGGQVATADNVAAGTKLWNDYQALLKERENAMNAYNAARSNFYNIRPGGQ